MSLNWFINTGADGATVNDMKKSIAREDDLQKAMNRAGLVQKDVQVKGKNGQTFTRKQWVKASDAQQSQQKTSSPNKTMSDLRSMSKEDLKKFLDDAPAGTEIKGLCSKRTGNELVVKKHEGYKAVYGGIGAGTRIKESYWQVDGSPDHYISVTIREAINGTSKYYKVSDSTPKSNEKSSHA